MAAVQERGPCSLVLPDELIDEIARRAAALVLEQLHRQTSEESPFMTIAEAAAFARCKRQRIDDLLSARRLTRYKDGRRTLIDRTELTAYLAARTGPGSRPGADSIFARSRATVTHSDNTSRAVRSL